MYLLFGALNELLFLLIFIFTIPLGYIFPLTGINKSSFRKYPIVFVHGWLNQNLLFYFLKRHLEKQGYKVFMTNFGLLTRNISRSAALLSNYIDNNNLRNITLIGASIGGLIGLDYLQKLNGWSKVNKFIAIGTPFTGSNLARLTFFSELARQISPNSQYLQNLFSNKIKNLRKIICIYSNYDELVSGKNATINGAINKRLNVIGHANLLAFSHRTFELLTKHASL